MGWGGITISFVRTAIIVARLTCQCFAAVNVGCIGFKRKRSAFESSGQPSQPLCACVCVCVWGGGGGGGFSLIHMTDLHPQANVHPGANLFHRICTTWKGGANSHPDAHLHPVHSHKTPFT